MHEGEYYVREEYYVRDGVAAEGQGGESEGFIDRGGMRGTSPQPSIDVAICEVRRRLCISESMLISLLIIYSRVELADGAKLIISLPRCGNSRKFTCWSACV